MKKCNQSKAFTMVELMVSIFITITIIASFYKLYNASVRTERSSSIRIAVDIMGEQILDTISESVRLIGLNSVKGDFKGEGNGGVSLIIRSAQEYGFEYLSPFGSPITKVAAVSGSYTSSTPACTFTLFNSASFHSSVDKLYFHNQDGFFKATVSNIAYSDSGVGLTATFGGSVKPSDSDGECRDIFPVGSLVTGEDFIYNLQYTTSGSGNTEQNSLKLSYAKESSPSTTKDLIDFSYTASSSRNSHSMPKFVMEYLVETCDGTKCESSWQTPVNDNDKIKTIVAVRFGFVLLSKKERVYSGDDTPGSLPKYCIFETFPQNENYCYQLTSLNYTASVFRRVVYLSNYRFLKEQATD